MREGDGLVLPAHFLSVAERFGLIRAIDRWVIAEAVRLLVRAPEGEVPCVEINLSCDSLSDDELPAYIERVLGEGGVDPERIIFEVTETAAIANMAEAQVFVERVRELGCRFALDDFGAGFASFYYLKHLPFDYLKIDGEFIRNLPANATDRLIVEAVVATAKGMGKQTIAEFVGDESTVELLRELDVDYAQGYHLGRPGPAGDMLAAIAA
jgi:EAL domain-containing protein (putative c-di-GMP-specific phosphodiesterase class I)